MILWEQARSNDMAAFVFSCTQAPASRCIGNQVRVIELCVDRFLHCLFEKVCH
jgi:hypothetical protein